MIAAALPLGGFALTAMAKAIQTLYGAAQELNDFLDNHINGMKTSDNPIISRSGRVLEAAKVGFGIGYISSVIIIAAGQLLLGNTLQAMTTIVIVGNPVAMTCAALGAVIYGYGALNDEEKEELLLKLSHGFDVGIELIKAIIGFIINIGKALFDDSKQYLKELKVYIKDMASNFGKKLGDVTGDWGDKANDLVDTIKEKTDSIVDDTIDTSNKTIEKTKEMTSQIETKISEAYERATSKNGDTTHKKQNPLPLSEESNK